MKMKWMKRKEKAVEERGQAGENLPEETAEQLSEKGETVTADCPEDSIIWCDGLVKIYKTKEVEVMALSGLELSVQRGEMMAIIGKSGSGKSTFLNMLGGLVRPSAGKLIVDGKDMSLLTREELVQYKRETVGFVWQNNSRNLFPYLNAVDNVMAPMLFCKGGTKEKAERALQLLELVGMAHKRDSMLKQLSGGEQQRIAIAIALANEPEILLADEPTGAVDVKTANHIFELFRRLNEELGLTIVIVTHDNKIAKMVQRVVRIQDGKISSEQIMKQEYERSLAGIGLNDLDMSESTHEEYSILDKFGRLQLPEKLLEEAGIEGKKVRLEMVDGNIVVKRE
ncbi:MAG: ABC transporter ATP-binding protein [Bacteroidales bacterium]|nr:ABC transporter ATP-binding protein [Clostridium sp.]MCM1203523.1 ABC transporter ATP-binding protein [Bacteroidales bacterium]